MPRLLKRSTILKAFLRRRWLKVSPMSDFLVSPDLNPGERIFASIDDSGRIELTDACWVKASNVHIVSYWGPFRNTVSLETSLDKIEKVYSILCGTKFHRISY